MLKIVKRIFAVIATLALLAVVVVGCYIGYLMITYNRIVDPQRIMVEHDVADTVLQPNQEYTATTYNIGFGAYTPDYSFFMDKGIMADGTKTVGVHSVAASEESVRASTKGAIAEIEALHPDFALFQEVDTDSTRSFGVDQKSAITAAFSQMGSAFAVNFHSSFLAYPLPEMHGFVNSGVLSLTGSHVAGALRRSYPIDESFPTRFFDLDRCFLVERLQVSDGHDLVLINSHMSAFDEGGKIRARQFSLLMDVAAKEVAAGNYVVIGGDWNHALCGSLELYPSRQQVPPWIVDFDKGMLPSGFSVVEPDNLAQVPTCRGADIPYEAGKTYTVTVDGFIVSSNVQATAHNVDTGFVHSDHNPVQLTFKLISSGDAKK